MDCGYSLEPPHCREKSLYIARTCFRNGPSIFQDVVRSSWSSSGVMPHLLRKHAVLRSFLMTLFHWLYIKPANISLVHHDFIDMYAEIIIFFHVIKSCLPDAFILFCL